MATAAVENAGEGNGAGSPGGSIRNRWAKRLIREKLAEELNLLQSKRRTIPGVPAPGTGGYSGAFTHDNLPPDPMSDNYESPPTPGYSVVTEPPRKVCIVGAGVAGLYIAMILDDLNIPNLTYDIFESSSRIGGRVYTHHFSETKHDYYDIGAMRYPKIPSMDRTFDLFTRTKMPLIEYHLNGVQTPKLFNDQLFKKGVVDPYFVSKKNGGTVPNDVVDNVDDILKSVFGPYKKKLAKDFEAGFRELMKVDDMSTREYLKRGGPDGTGVKYNFYAIQWMETQNTGTNLFDESFTEMVIDSFDFDNPIDPKWWCIEGGTSLLTDAMSKGLKHPVKTGKRVEAIYFNRKITEDGNMSVKVVDEPIHTGYNGVFCTTTLGCLGRMDLRTLELDSTQKAAVRSLHYDSSVKVALKFKYPWWITRCGITKGGSASTDLPLRTCVYPSYNLHDDPLKPAVLLASYTWSQDATRVGSLVNSSAPSGRELVDLVLRDLARLHRLSYDEIRDAYADEYHAFSWQHDPNMAGAFAMFGPGQFSNMYPHLMRPAANGKFHIVGEAASVHHAWIIGALESAYNSIIHYLYKNKLWAYLFLLQERWGFDVSQELEVGKNGFAHLLVRLGEMGEDEKL